MINRNLKFIQSVYKFHGTELSEALRILESDVIGPKVVELGWTISKDNDENLVTFKTSMFSGAGLSGYHSVVSAAKEPFSKRMAGDENTIPRSLRWEVFRIVAAHGGLEDNHDMFYLAWLAGGTTHGATGLWEWTKENWERVEKEVPVDIASLFLGTALEGLHTQEQIEDVKGFCAMRDTKLYQMVLDHNLEGMENRRSWAECDVSNVRSWLKSHGNL
ncbi:uncharacterized protein FMAN_05128 [Fusarium mangiferae]|uniref:ERAP1-like C-terminal domain-containing protein n=1 Tax=Fusarium mangiferae TaxID=192010 RepID=A0A1L7UM85_FUSMA|nr:uncharacterized protein FMAN_05128 [Fusarium mangiferae]CVL08346.1 uncharacterized protein FMAN_05128 [Fusarium mangiferae]